MHSLSTCSSVGFTEAGVRCDQTRKHVTSCAGIIYASYDGGSSWEEPTVLSFDAGDAPSTVVVAQGRIWKAVPGDTGATFASAPVVANLTDEDSWTVAGPGNDAPGRNLEAVTVRARAGAPGAVMTAAPAELPSGDAGIALAYSDGPRSTTFDPRMGVGYTPLFQAGKFGMLYDEVSDRYWALVNTEDAWPRNILMLFVSRDLKRWQETPWGLHAPSSRCVRCRAPILSF